MAVGVSGRLLKGTKGGRRRAGTRDGNGGSELRVL